MANKFVVLLVVSMLSLDAKVRADGYPKETPTIQEASLDERPTSGEAMSSQTSPGGSSGVALPSQPPSPPEPSYNSFYAGLVPWLYAVNQYPVSTDYVSRYYGPIAVPTVLADGTIADTPAVAAARAAHLAALNQAKALWFGKFDDGSYDPLKYGDYAAQYYTGSLLNKQYLDGLAAEGYLNKQYLDALAAQGPLNKQYFDALAAQAPLNKQYLPPLAAQEPLNKQYLDALAVQGSLNKQYHDALAAQAPLNKQYLDALAVQGSLNNQYHDALVAQAPLNKQYLDALAAQGPLNKQYLDALAAQGPLNKQYLDALAAQGPLNKPYFGPLATPIVLPSGYLADTPAIAAARATHLAALAKAHADAALWRSHYNKV